MDEAAAEMRFEAAANRRDQIEALESTVGRQRVVSQTAIDADALGYALREDTGCLTVLQIREGRVVHQDSHLLDGVSGSTTAEVVNQFTKLHYQKAADAPREVLLPVEIEDATSIADLLAERRGSKVRLFAPRRGAKKDLVSMAMENAAEHLRAVLERESASRRRGEEAVADLQNVLSLPVAPRRIEAFDISNVSGTQAVGSMIVFEDGLPKKSDYRRFRIRLSEGSPNDYEMMREVLSRRLSAAVSGNVKFEHLPDLLLVDGGPGQLGVALRAMQDLGLSMPAAGLAKEHEYVYLPARSAPISLPSHSRALHLLQQVRDEAHRFALEYHRSLRARRARESLLDEVAGIGEVRKRRLLKRFGSVNRIRSASPEDIAEAAGCSLETARAVLQHLQSREPAQT